MPRLTKEGIFKSLAAVAAADGELAQEELATLDRIRVRMGIASKDGARLISEVKHDREAQKHLMLPKDPTEGGELLEDMVRIAAADGILEPSERKLLEKVRRALGIDEKRLESLIAYHLPSAAKSREPLAPRQRAADHVAESSGAPVGTILVFVILVGLLGGGFYLYQGALSQTPAQPETPAPTPEPAPASTPAPVAPVASATPADPWSRLVRGLTRGIKKHPFVGATALVEVELDTGAVHAAVVRSDTTEVLALTLDDGREIEVKRARVRRCDKLAPDAFASRARAELEQRTARAASGLELYRDVVTLAFERGLEREGESALRTALAGEDGDAAIEMFGEGDLDALHEARAKFFPAKPRKPAPAPAPKPVPAPVPKPEAPAEPVTPKPPEPVEPPTAGLATLPAWKEACDRAQEAIALYRASFGGKTAAERANVKKARDLFEKARAALDSLPRELSTEDADTVDRKTIEVNALLRDVKKRIKTFE